ncbi:hypothetical protein Droror1_Dr00022755 [Drosera rotundifolia]
MMLGHLLKDLEVVCSGANVKDYVHVRVDVSGSPLECPETFSSIGRVRVRHRNILLTLKGTVIRSGAVKTIEGERVYECLKCKNSFPIFPELENGNYIKPPLSCLSEKSRSCEGTRFRLLEGSSKFHDYQEINIQENTQHSYINPGPRDSIRILTFRDS